VVIQPGYILTNRHVVSDGTYGLADGITIPDKRDAKNERELDATIVAISTDEDLAVLRCPKLAAQAALVSDKAPRRGAEVLILGFPRFDKLGGDIKTTKGIVTALPDASHSNAFLFDAEANPGNSGGPVCDDRGAVFAILTYAYGQVGWGNYSGGIPLSIENPLIRQHLTQARAIEPAAPKLLWPDVDEKISESTVMVRVYRKQFAMGLDARAAAQAGGHHIAFEDKTCSVCHGLGSIRCPETGCSRGTISITVNDQAVQRIGKSEQLIPFKRREKQRCPTCNGKGSVDCPACSNGVDRNLR
jgi:S1-C subfamily serine protease